ncbi:MAG: TerD family protein [Thermoguttaceae bacterium]|nr:TerD family protein [Thermoguttaceae bacterium]
MAVSLTKGQHAPLAQGLNQILVTLGWQERKDSNEKFDLDASCFLLGENGKVRSSRDFVYYKQKDSWGDAIVYGGDVKRGGADCETFKIDLSQIPADVAKLVFVVTIYKGRQKYQNFGMLESAFINIVDVAVDDAIAQFYLTADASKEIAVIFGELYRKNGAWRFRALGEGFNSNDPNCRHELQALARHYGAL